MLLEQDVYRDIERNELLVHILLASSLNTLTPSAQTTPQERQQNRS
jgi:hypothetical protein